MSQRFVLRPALPVRAFGIAAVVELVGAVLIVLGAAWSLLAVIIVGAVIAVLGLALLAVAVLGYLRLGTRVELDDHGIRISSSGRQVDRSWRVINRVSAQQTRIYLDTDSDDREMLQIVCPRGSDDPEVQRLTEALARRLDRDRGYRPL